MTLTIIKPGLRAAGDLPVHPTLTHPRTGLPLVAVGFRRDGRVIWPQLGGDGTDPPADPPANPPAGPPPADPPRVDPPDEPLGPGGKKALAEERAARKALEKQLGELAPLKQLANLLGGKPTGDGKTDLEKLTERLAAQEQSIEAERQARWRAEVQADKGLTAKQAARLVGSTKEELLADADELLETFVANRDGGDDGQDDGKRRKPGMRPDPAQGARPGQKASSLDAGRSLYAERHKKTTTG
jgi:hypothetical protein